MNEQSAATLLGFLEQYSTFLQSMLDNEKEKLAALLSNSLPRIEHCILTAQADTKQLENLEKKRMTLQQNIGCGGYTLEQLVNEVPDNTRARMSDLCAQVRNTVDEIRFHNDKSMDIARTNVKQINPDALEAQPKRDAAHNPYTKAKNAKQADDTVSILETKI
ncbi:MAG: hypothetical protein RR573_04895 [Oscillospiraceae bacterium]